MFASRLRGALTVCSVLAVAACANNSEPGTPTNTTPSAVAIVSGNGQVGLVGTALSLPLVVKVSSGGTLVSGASVTFTVVSGTATVSPGTATTDPTGQAKAQVTLGSSPGNITISATITGTNLTATFLETAGTSTITLACQSGSPTTPAVGGVLPGVSGTGVCLGGGTAGADYALIPFHANTDASAIASISVASRGATPLSSATIAPSFAETVNANIMRARRATARSEIEARLRQSERTEFTPKIAAARAAYRNRSKAAFATIPGNTTVGTIFTLNAAISPACSSPINVGARVAAVSNLAIVLADTANPSGGFTDAEYASFGATFDTLISPLDIATFGAPSDVDLNGKTLILFTKEVNKLTPRGSNGVFGGFFHVRDLFPKVDRNDGLGSCPSSNFAEIYYSLVPDPNGTFSDSRGKVDVQNLTASTLVHEFQHLINAGRRMYVNDASDFEEGWLNEGLSHIAEELLYYKVAGLAPRQNITANVIGANAAAANNFNNYQADNNGRFEEYISKTAVTSVYADNDSLETRGATWNLLRYLADHRGTSDGDTWSQLVNTTLFGQDNLAHVFGSNFLTQIRDWTTSVFADDLTGQSDVRFSSPSWNLRNIFPRLVNNAGQPLGKYPLTVVPLGDASPANVSIVGGAAAYIRFTVPANTSASIDWSASGLPVSPLMQFTVVRSR